MDAGAHDLADVGAFGETERQNGAGVGRQDQPERGQHVEREHDLQQHGRAAEDPEIDRGQNLQRPQRRFAADRNAEPYDEAQRHRGEADPDGGAGSGRVIVAEKIAQERLSMKNGHVLAISEHRRLRRQVPLLHQRCVRAVLGHRLQRRVELGFQSTVVLADGNADLGGDVEGIACDVVGIRVLVDHRGDRCRRGEGRIDTALGERGGDVAGARQGQDVDLGLAGRLALFAEFLGRRLERGVDGGTGLQPAQRGGTGHLFRIALLHHDLVSDEDVGDEVHGRETLRRDVKAADTDIDAPAEEGRHHALELHAHHVGGETGALGEFVDEIDVEAHRLAVTHELEGRKRRRAAPRELASFDQLGLLRARDRDARHEPRRSHQNSSEHHRVSLVSQRADHPRICILHCKSDVSAADFLHNSLPRIARGMLCRKSILVQS